jgi:multiple sugar transport system substrate-binding protein
MLAVIAALSFSACGSSSTSPAPSSSSSPSVGGSQSPVSGGGSPTVIRWFVGVGPGTATAQVSAEKAFVASYNSVNKDGITIKLEVEPSTVAADVLKTEMASGDSPDIVGPLATADRAGLDGLFLNLNGEIARNNYDLQAFPDTLVKFLQSGDGQIGLPYLVDPAYIWYDKDAFDKAGLPPLPSRVGDLYQGVAWDWTELGKVAAQLTLDKNNKKSTDSGFDKANIVKYGFDCQGCDPRQLGSLFGGGSFVDTDGKTAVIPPAWSDAFNWYYNAIWTGHYAPSATAESTALLLQGSSMASGNVAMNVAWASSIPTLWDASSKTAKMKSWDIGVMPSWKGNTTSPLDAESFSITKASQNPDAAFKALLAIMADTTLANAYGGFPARSADQTGYINTANSTLATIFPGIDVSWDVMNEMIDHPALPSPETALPGLVQSSGDAAAFLTKLQTTSGLDVNAELGKLKTTLQADFAAAQPIVNQ